MKKISYINSTYKNNECFNEKLIFRDNFLFFITNLKLKFKMVDMDIGTSDINEPCNSDICLQEGLQTKIFDIEKEKYYLLLLESPHVDKSLVDKKNHKYFKKIFTWNDDFIDNKKYFKINYAFNIPKKIPKKFYDKKLCCTIAGNKFANHLDELYTKRVELIRWFEENHLDDFDLYGTGWNEYRFGHSFVGRVLNKVKFLQKKDLFPSYKGMVESKNETMQKYKFAICYENIKDQNGYITEKIFDCFFAGCVPIYWGAKNITEHIPKECFVDKREFNSFEELYDYMVNMDEKTYMNYLDEIEKFLNSKKADPFRAEVFAETIVSEILKDTER